MPPPALKEIEGARIAAEDLLGDVDLRIYVHEHYGKGFMKKCRVSPDAFIQMALQLAYFRVIQHTHLQKYEWPCPETKKSIFAFIKDCCEENWTNRFAN